MKKKRRRNRNSFSFELNIDNKKKKKRTKRIKKNKTKKRVRTRKEKASGWTIEGGKTRSLRSKKTKNERKKWSPHLERRYCFYSGYFDKYKDDKKSNDSNYKKIMDEYYKQKYEYKTSTIEPDNDYKKCMDAFNKTLYGRIKKSFGRKRR